MRRRPRVLDMAGIVAMAGCAALGAGEQKDLVWPPPPNPPRIEYVGSLAVNEEGCGGGSWFRRAFGLLAGEPESRGLVRPYGVFVDGHGKVYVADAGGANVKVFDPAEKTCGDLIPDESVNLVSPIGIAVGEGGTAYVADSVVGGVVSVSGKDGKTKRFLESGQVARPAGIALDAQGRLYVADMREHRVLVFSAAGELLLSLGRRGAGPGEFNFPLNVRVDREGRLLVVDSLNFRVQRLSADGTYLGGFGRQGDGGGDFSRPRGIAVDSLGHVYVTDANLDEVQIFDETGRYLLSFGASGSGPGEFWMPAGIFVDPADRIYVVDSYNQRVQVFQYLSGPEEAAGQPDGPREGGSR